MWKHNGFQWKENKIGTISNHRDSFTYGNQSFQFIPLHLLSFSPLTLLLSTPIPFFLQIFPDILFLYRETFNKMYLTRFWQWYRSDRITFVGAAAAEILSRLGHQKIGLRFGSNGATCQKAENNTKTRFVSVKIQNFFSKLQKCNRENSKGLFLLKPMNIPVSRQKSHWSGDTCRNLATSRPSSWHTDVSGALLTTP